MNISIIISCYNGDYNTILSHLKGIDINIILYNKKNNDFGIPVKNVGVDAYDKLHFIVNNYDNLPDICFFSTDSMYFEKKKYKKIDYIIKNLSILKDRSGFLTGHIWNITNTDVNFKLDVYRNKKLIPASIRPFSKWFNHYINKDVDINKIYVCKKSTFAVTKDLILSYSKKYYETLLKEVENHSVNGHDSEVPHYFERAWVELFCKNNTELMFHDFNRYGNII